MGIYDRDYMHEPPRRPRRGFGGWLIPILIILALWMLYHRREIRRIWHHDGRTISSHERRAPASRSH